MSSQFTTEYDDFQSTINSAYGDGGPWACSLYSQSGCRLQTRQHIDSTTIEYLAFGGTLGAMLRVRPELARPGQKMTYTWQYSACMSPDNDARTIQTGVGVSSTSSYLSACPKVGQPKTENGEFTISNDGTFSIYLSSNFGAISTYITGMKFSMSPKESSGNPTPTPVGGSQGMFPLTTTSPDATVTLNSAASPSAPHSDGSIGASTGRGSSTSSNIAYTTSLSTHSLSMADVSISEGLSQTTQRPVVSSSTAGRSANSSSMIPIIVGSILGIVSAVSIVAIVMLCLRQRQRNRTQAKLASDDIPSLVDDEFRSTLGERHRNSRLSPVIYSFPGRFTQR